MATKDAKTSRPKNARKSPRRRKLSFRDRLSRLTYHQACQLLGDEGQKLLAGGARGWEIDPEEDVYLGGDLYRVRLIDSSVDDGRAIVVLTQMSARSKDLHLTCDRCERPCEHAGAALAFLLDEKLLLGLSTLPDETVPLELLTEEELTQRALAERKERAENEQMTLRSMNPDEAWTDYTITSHVSGKTYRLALHGEEHGRAYCSCPDFRTNRLGTCKHILHALEKVRKRFNKKELAKPYEHKQVALWLDYRDPIGLRFSLPAGSKGQVTKIVGEHDQQPITNASAAVKLVRQLERDGEDVLIYPDAEEWLERQLTQTRLQAETAEIRLDPKGHPLRKGLLKTELLPYQMDGVAFAVGAGRAVLADDMGLGKTIQGIGVAELFARTVGIERVLVVCPASLKSQWNSEIERFCERDAQIVYGRADERPAQYANGTFFTICNYEQVLRDLEAIEAVPWDLIILDEGQRIKNWESKTSQTIRSLKSRFALVLSGTPLENRLDELYTVVKFIDEYRLGPAHQFFHRHRIVDEKGKVEGYQNLDQLRELLKPILLRRTRSEVMKQLPERTNTVVKVTPTQEQRDIHTGHMQNVCRITSKPYLTEMDLLQLQKSLLMCRMVANSTFLTEKQEPSYSSKLERLRELLGELAEQPDRKVVVFSEWRRMHDKIEPILEELEIDFVRLDGQVPQKQRPALVSRFQEDEDCRVILMTNAGSTGLNLQAANTVINVDLPWNPAVLEQRIARAHRMGQKNPVHVYLLVTEETLEERLLDTLAMKQDLAIAALDADSDVTEVQMKSGMEELKRRMEQLLGEQPTAEIDQSQQNRVIAETERLNEHQGRVAAAGGELLGAAMQFVGELISAGEGPAPDPAMVDRLKEGLSDSVERDSDGRPQLRFTLPDDASLNKFAESLARLLVEK